MPGRSFITQLTLKYGNFHNDTVVQKVTFVTNTTALACVNVLNASISRFRIYFFLYVSQNYIGDHMLIVRYVPPSKLPIRNNCFPAIRNLYLRP